MWSVIFFGFAAPFAGAQELSELPLRRELPPPPPGPCEGVFAGEPSTPVPSVEDRREAERLLTEANRAAILGEREGALDLLRTAARLDPTSPNIAYRLGRMLEDGQEGERALREFCRYLALEENGSNVADVRVRVERLASTDDDSLTAEARRAFEEGIAAYDAGAFEAAARHFARALLEEPEWGDAHYNRGVTYLRMGRSRAAVADLEWYLDANPGTPDRARVEAHLRQLAPTLEPEYNRRTALAAGLFVPGMGHFYSGRLGTGFLVLAAATTSAGVGLLHRTVEVQCRGIPVDGECPPADVLDRREERPLLVPGLLGAAAITVVGAIHAYRGIDSPGSGFAFDERGMAFPVVGREAGPGKVIPFLTFEPLPWTEGAGARAGLELRF